MKLDLNDPKIALIHGALIEVLEKHDAAKVPQYFTEDAVMILNEKKLQGSKEIANRIAWVKENIHAVKVKLHNTFFVGDEGFDHHTTELIEKNGKRCLYKIFGYTQIRDGKIARYEDVTIQVAGEEAMGNVTSTT